MSVLASIVIPFVVACGSAKTSTPHAEVPAAVRDVVLGFSAHLLVIKGNDAFPEYRDVISTAQRLDHGVLAASPVAFGELEIKNVARTFKVNVKGIDPTRLATLYRLGPWLDDDKSLVQFATPSDVGAILVGRGLMKKLYSYPGEEVTLSGPGGSRVVKIAGAFHFDNLVLDDLVFATFTDVAAVLGRGDRAKGVEITLSDVDRVAEMAQKLGKELGASYQVVDWYELNKATVDALTR